MGEAGICDREKSPCLEAALPSFHSFRVYQPLSLLQIYEAHEEIYCQNYLGPLGDLTLSYFGRCLVGHVFVLPEGG